MQPLYDLLSYVASVGHSLYTPDRSIKQPPPLPCMYDALGTYFGEYLLHVSTFATTRVALPTGVEPG
jgi:hypothetical protein